MEDSKNYKSCLIFENQVVNYTEVFSAHSLVNDLLVNLL